MNFGQLLQEVIVEEADEGVWWGLQTKNMKQVNNSCQFYSTLQPTQLM